MDQPSQVVRAIQDREGWTDQTLLQVLLDALDDPTCLPRNPVHDLEQYMNERSNKE